MRTWLVSVARNTALRGEEPRNRFGRWTARWFAPTPTLPGSFFQAADEPFPDHWREIPAPWLPLDPADLETRALLVVAVNELPEQWRRVVVARDAFGRQPLEVSSQLGLTLQEQRAILNRSRALLRERLTPLLTRRDQ